MITDDDEERWSYEQLKQLYFSNVTSDFQQFVDAMRWAAAQMQDREEGLTSPAPA